MAREDCLSWQDVMKMLDTLETECRQRNLPGIFRLLHKHIHGFTHPGNTPNAPMKNTERRVIPFPMKLEGVA
jgi:hypothetical protein